MTCLFAGGYDLVGDVSTARDIDNYPKWPDILANKLNINKVINTTMLRGGNDLAFNSAVDSIITNKPKIITLLLTSWDKQTPYDCPINPFEVADQLIRRSNKADLSNAATENCNEELLLSEYVLTKHMNVSSIVNDNLRMLYTLQEMCKEHSIQLLVAQGVDPINYYTVSNIRKMHLVPHDWRIKYSFFFHKEVLNSVYFNKIDWDKMTIGGPFFNEINGKSLNTLVREKLAIPDDEHPSAKGHEAVAQIFYEEYKKRYV